ncbi:MAG: hypothetical protein IJF43_03480, partial [Firmicutes bacterium]|nr:hypothetical protein [Bacillota bacterium]
MKKKGIVLFLAVLLIFAFAIPVSAAEFAGGTGTEADPYLIADKYQLNNVRNYTDAHFKMVNDVIFTEADFAKGGDFYNGGIGWEPIKWFSGVFNGNGYVVKGLYINITREKYSWVGLFTSNEGMIKNLGLVDGSVKVYSIHDDIYAGGIVGNGIGGTIDGCYNTGEVEVHTGNFLKVYVGGIVGYCDSGSTISNCYNTGNITADAFWGYCGGIVGYISKDNLISNCYNTGNISASDSAGGIVGQSYSYTSYIGECYNTGKISGGDAGGIIGVSYNDVENCYNTGSIEGSYSIGGIVGKQYGSSINNCYNIGNIVPKDDDDHGGAICGGTDGHYTAIYSCYYLRGCGLSYYRGIKEYTKEQMQHAVAFRGFDFDEIWVFDASSGYLYPQLRAFV